MKDDEVEQAVLKAYRESRNERQLSDALSAILKEQVRERMKAEAK